MFDLFGLFKSKSKNPIADLRSRDKHAWCKKYFPEYYDLFGGYPPSIKVIYGEPSNPDDPLAGASSGSVSFSGSVRPTELAPWEYFDGNDGSIDEYGNKWSVSYDSNGHIQMSKTPVSETEFTRWCDGLNYFKSGKGLDPTVFVGAIEYRGRQWHKDTALFNAQQGDRDAKYKTKPDRITCRTGIYLPEAGPNTTNPWGVNASFHPNGQTEPSYISKRWGPDYRPDSSQLPGAPEVIWWNEAEHGPRPTQEEYDRARYTVWL